MKNNFTLSVLAASLATLNGTTLLIDDISPQTKTQPTLTKYDLERIEAAKQKRIRRALRKKQYESSNPTTIR